MAEKFETPWMGGGPAQANEAVTVRNATDTADATVYTDTAGTAGTNPVNTDSNGLLVTYLNPGRYVLKSANDRLEVTVGTGGTDTPAKPDITGVKATDGPAIIGQMLAAGEAKGLWTDSTT